MDRIVKCSLFVLVTAFAVTWLASPQIVRPPTVRALPRSEPVVFATGSLLTSTVTDASATLERVPVASAPPTKSVATPPITFRMIGAPTAQLNGVGSVLRKDDSNVRESFVGGRLTMPDRATLSSVALRVSGFAIAWPQWDASSEVIEVHMQRAGSICVRLVDSSGALLADRCVWCVCQKSSDVVPPGLFSGNAHAVTDAAGIATLENLVPGSYDLGAGRLAEWQAVKLEGVTVTADCVTTRDLVAVTLAPTQYGGFYFPVPQLDDLTFVRGFGNTVNRWGFATDLGCLELNHIGGQVRCIARGRPGQQITGHIVAFDDDGELRPELRRSVPITITIGAVMPWWPVWQR